MPSVQLLSEHTCIYFHSNILDSRHIYHSAFAQLQMVLASLHDTDHLETHTVPAMIDERNNFNFGLY